MIENTGSYHDDFLIECYSARTAKLLGGTADALLVFIYASGEDYCLCVH